METQFESCVAPFRIGFEKVITSDLVEIFSEEEFEILLCGFKKPIDINDLRKNTKYSGGYKSNNRTIKNFWKVLGNFDEEEKRAFLKFVTCNERPPLLGFEYLNPPFQVQRVEGGEMDLPQAATCFNVLKLPKYGSTSLMRDKLKMAIKYNKGFYVA